MAEKKDYYEVLGVDRNATDEQIKAEYRKKAKKYHPDLNPDDSTAEARFKELGEAYEVLSDKEKRAKYDQFGHAGVDPSYGAGQGYPGGFGAGGFGMDDILEQILGQFGMDFGGGRSRRSGGNPNAARRGGDVHVSLPLTFMEAAHGCTKQINITVTENCSECHGSGAARGTSPKTCEQCHGEGYVTVQQRMMGYTRNVAQVCPSCGGKGKKIENPCPKCNGNGRVKVKRKLDIPVPAGIDDDQSLSLRGRGDVGLNGGPSGDVVVVISVRPDTLFERQRYDVYVTVPITFAQAALGDEITVPTIDGKLSMKIPPGTQSETKFRLEKKGIPFLNGSGRGNQFVTVQIEVPKKLGREQKQALQQFERDLTVEKNYDRRKSFQDRVRKAFSEK